MTVSKFKLQKTCVLPRRQFEDGRQNAWNKHALVALHSWTVPDEYGPDVERQDVKRDEKEYGTVQQQVKTMTQSRVRSDRSPIINEYESDKTMSNETILMTSNREKSFFARNKEGDGQKKS